MNKEEEKSTKMQTTQKVFYFYYMQNVPNDHLSLETCLTATSAITAPCMGFRFVY